MSRDLSVYLPDRPDPARLAAVAAANGLELTPSGTLRHDDEYCADLGDPEPVHPGDIPTQVEPDDLDEPLASVLEACGWSVSVVVQGSAPAGVERAVAFARELAADHGVVEDPATGLWHQGVTHRPSSHDQVVDVVQLRWYARRADVPLDLAPRWLDACRTHLPAALPRRFGDDEPPRHHHDVEGDAGFVAAYGEALREQGILGGSVLFRCTRPCFEGSLAGSGRGRVGTHRLTLDRDVDPVALHALFVAVAEATSAFWASASVLRGYTWTGRALFVTAGTEEDEYLTPGGNWLGLPARPVAWSWFGPAYRRLVPATLATEPAGGGLLHRWSDTVADRDELPATWLPPALTSGGRDAPAARLPRGLRTSTWDRLLGRG